MSPKCKDNKRIHKLDDIHFIIETYPTDELASQCAELIKGHLRSYERGAPGKPTFFNSIFIRYTFHILF